jgi:hypothetical protein
MQPADVGAQVNYSDVGRTSSVISWRTAGGDDVSVSFKLEPDVLGGLIVRAGDLVIDGSVIGSWSGSSSRWSSVRY